MTKLQELKQKNKELASKIRELKATRKSVPYGYVSGLADCKYLARHHHIAYCMLRGRRYEEIEDRCSKAYNDIYVEAIMEDYSEDVCTGTQRSS